MSYLDFIPDSLRKYLSGQGTANNNELPGSDKDYTILTENPGVEVRAVLRQQGFDPFGRRSQFFTKRLSRGDQEVGPFEDLYNLYTPYKEGAAGDSQTLGRFAKGYIDQAVNPGLASDLGYSPAHTYAEAAALAAKNLSPDSDTIFTAELRNAVGDHDDTRIFQAIYSALTDSGLTIFSDRDINLIQDRLLLIKAHYDDAKYAGTFSGNMLEYLGGVGATLIQDLMPGVDLSMLKDWSNFDSAVPATTGSGGQSGTKYQ